MVAIRDELAKVMKPLSDFIKGIADIVNAIISTLGSAFKDIQGTLEKVKSGLGEFENIVKPIKDAFDAIERAIAPVKWVLDALECIIKKILEPVVDEILKATGIEALLKPLLDQIETALGVKPLFDLIQANINERSSTEWQGKGGTQAVSAGSTAWSGIVSNLKQYNSRDKGNTYQLIMKMVEALTNSPSGQGPFVLPDWPEIPPIFKSGAQLATSNRLQSETGLGTAYLRAERQKKLTACYACMKTMALPMTTVRNNVSDSSLPLWVTDTLATNNVIKTSYDDVGLSNVTKLLQIAAEAKQSLQDALTIGPQLVASLQAYDKSRMLPAYFQEEMQDFSMLFSDGVKVMEFLIGYNWTTGIFEDIEQVFRDQAAAANGIYAKSEELLLSGQNVDTAIEKLEAQEPTKQQFANSLQYIDQVAAGAAAIGNTLRIGLALNAKLKNQFSDRLAVLLTQTNENADAALNQMTTIHATVMAAISQADMIIKYLAAYALKFTKLGTDSASVSANALPGLAKGVQLCNTVASILDPLSGILADMDCKAKNSITSGAQVEFTMFKKEMQSIIDQQNPAITSAFEFITGKVVPSAVMTSDIEDINNFIGTHSKSFNDATAELSASFDLLKDVMAPTKTFDYQCSVSYKVNPPISIGPDGKATGGGQTVNKQVNQKIDNFFIDIEFKQAVLQLIADMNDAAVEAGLTAATGGFNE
jgi:hypothetical protein